MIGCVGMLSERTGLQRKNSLTLFLIYSKNELIM